MIYSLLKPLIFQLEAERAHNLSITALSYLPGKRTSVDPDPVLSTQLCGLDLPNPVGLAPGYDKDARVPIQALRLGFGMVEVGTLTPKPQAGNPKPRLFRLKEDEAVINRMGFNNGGIEAALDRLHAVQGRGIIGINIGANKDSEDRIADYKSAFARVAPLASYITINISSPNTPGLRALQDESALKELLGAIHSMRKPGDPPVFLKLAPDLEPEDVAAIARLTPGLVDALIISNTTISRPALQSRHAGEAGGLSGAPLKAMAQQRMLDFRRATNGMMPLIGVGGVASGADAYARIRAGASAVQLYSALVFQGPGLVRKINRELKALLLADGFSNVQQAVGVDA